VVGDEEASDLTSAMVLADLLAADLAAAGDASDSAGDAPDSAGDAPDSAGDAPDSDATTGPRPAAAGASPGPGVTPLHARPMSEGTEADEAARLAVTVSQLEHALTARVRVEQAIGVLAERHRLRTRDAFDLLRNAARSRGRRVIDIAEDVVNSASNSLLRLPEELERKPEPRARIRSARRSRTAG